MSAYDNPRTTNDTTPWLREQKNNPDFIVFKNAYTSRVNTVLSLERALTEKNQYNSLEFRQSATIIDIAKKAGYYTGWYSNQGTTDEADTPITIVGKTADTKKWTNQDLNTLQYDGTLLNYLKEVNPSKNNFIVLHFMGSHDNYQNRYPVKFAKWGDLAKTSHHLIMTIPFIIQTMFSRKFIPMPRNILTYKPCSILPTTALFLTVAAILT